MKRLALSALLFSLPALAFDNPYTMRSPRGLLMGDAFTAVNDDAFTLFYNPATLGRHKSDLTLYPLNGTVTGTNVLASMDRFKDFPNDPVGASDRLMNFPAHAGVNTAPGFKMFNVGVTAIVADSYDLLLRNPANPTLDLDIRQDRGVQAGFAIPIGNGRLNKKTQKGSQTSLGVGAKYIERTGVADQIGLVSPTGLNCLGQDKVEQMAKCLGRVRGQGWGFDAGVEHVVKVANAQLVLGLVALDITGTEFKVPDNPNHLKVANNRDQVNAAAAFGQDFGVFHYIVSSDVRALNEQMDFGKRLRMGGEIGVPGLSVMAGMNSGYYSYGASLDFGFLKTTAGIYEVEVGSKYRQQKSSRFVISVSLFNFSFDA
ncbi:MAG: hypothetical protein ACJ76H_11470 [Bacteriovoracaceae bacterium]